MWARSTKQQHDMNTPSPIPTIGILLLEQHDRSVLVKLPIRPLPVVRPISSRLKLCSASHVWYLAMSASVRCPSSLKTQQKKLRWQAETRTASEMGVSGDRPVGYSEEASTSCARSLKYPEKCTMSLYHCSLGLGQNSVFLLLARSCRLFMLVAMLEREFRARQQARAHEQFTFTEGFIILRFGVIRCTLLALCCWMRLEL
mmetsp:Transcript_17625/g.35405  ORF Transcript_17625/g.35405 Transcript_17625/m.35405 type:complete len:201 (+) Transcript_17625:194-796(+)